VELLDRPLDQDGFMDRNSEEGNRPFFDDFSWRAFVALNWPAQDGVRGQADRAKKFGEPGAVPTVWETWKSGPEIVPPGGQKPTAWDKDKPTREKKLSRIHKFVDFNQAGIGSLEAPLIDQGRKFVRYELHVNKIEFQEIFARELYTKVRLNAAAMASSGGKVEFPKGSIEVKAAWRELPNDADILKRFYWRDAVVVDWDQAGNEKDIPTKVGLVGLHIVTKTEQRPNWIWSTFEHEDNVVSSPNGIRPPSFNSKSEGTKWVSPGPTRPDGWENIKKGVPLPSLAPVEVSRKLDFTQFPSTEKINDRYRGHSQVRDKVWSHYRLTRTQWPILGTGLPSPRSDVANVTMETYRQTVTCMACHNLAAKSRFVFFLELRVDPPTAQQNLRNTLRSFDR